MGFPVFGHAGLISLVYKSSNLLFLMYIHSVASLLRSKWHKVAFTAVFSMLRWILSEIWFKFIHSFIHIFNTHFFTKATCCCNKGNLLWSCLYRLWESQCSRFPPWELIVETSFGDPKSYALDDRCIGLPNHVCEVTLFLSFNEGWYGFRLRKIEEVLIR